MKDRALREKINKFFVELLGGCYHEWHSDRNEMSVMILKCSKCPTEITLDKLRAHPDFFTGAGFFELLRFAVEQPFWGAFASQLPTGIYYSNARSTNLPLFAIDENVFPVELHEFLTANPEVMEKITLRKEWKGIRGV